MNMRLETAAALTALAVWTTTILSYGTTTVNGFGMKKTRSIPSRRQPLFMVCNSPTSFETTLPRPRQSGVVSSSPLPPSRGRADNGPKQTNRRRRRHKKTYPNNKRQSKHNNGMPKNVPKLSDVLKSATLEDFVGETTTLGTGSSSWCDEEPVEAVIYENTNDSGKVEEEKDFSKVAEQQPKQLMRARNGVVVSKIRNGDSLHAAKPKKVKEEANIQKVKRPAAAAARVASRNGKKEEDNEVEEEEPAHTEPWNANFKVSKQTQANIQAAARHRSGGSPTSRAICVLETFLKQDPTRCNPANVVCALTLTAKILGATPLDRYQHEELLDLQLQTLDVLHDLVLEQRLTARQLCNAVWATAKWYNRDSTLLPPPPQPAIMSTDEHLGTAETWVLQNEPPPRNAVCETIDAIARQLTEILSCCSLKSPPKVGEMSMASWAYGVLRPRRLPPGWSHPPQLGQLPQQQQPQQQRPRSGVEFITFEQWTKDHHDDEEDESSAQTLTGSSNDVTDQLLDAIGETLCKDMDRACLEDEKNESHNDNDASAAVGYKDNRLVRTLTWSELANVAWAYATHGHCRTHWSERVLLALARDVARRLHEGDVEHVLSRDVAQLVWALGTLQSDNFRLGDDLVHLVDAVGGHYLRHNEWQHAVDDSDWDDDDDNVAHRPLEAWSCPDLVQVAVSMAHGRIDHLPLLRAIYRESHARLYDSNTPSRGPPPQRRRAFRTWELVVLLWVQARLHLRSPQGSVFEDFASGATQRLARSLERANDASSSSSSSSSVIGTLYPTPSLADWNLAEAQLSLEPFPLLPQPAPETSRDVSIPQPMLQWHQLPVVTTIKQQGRRVYGTFCTACLEVSQRLRFPPVQNRG